MPGERSRVLTLVFTDLADSTALKSARGDDAVDALIKRHREHVTRLAEESSGRVVDWAGDGCFLTFETSSAAVMFALRLQQAHADESDLPGVRIGVHLGEVTESVAPDGSPQVKGLAVDVAARVQGLAKPGQILMSASVYDSARQRLGVEAFGEPILWRAHGSYKLKGVDKAYEISEAGLKGVSPMSAPKAGEKARRVRRWSQPHGEQSLPDVTRQFRFYGYVLLSSSLVILYVALQFRSWFVDFLGFMLLAFFAGSTAVGMSRRAHRQYRREGNLGKLPARYRSWSRRFLKLGIGFVLLGVLLSPLAGNATLYILAMVGIPFCAVGVVQLLFLRKISTFKFEEPSLTTSGVAKTPPRIPSERD